MVTDSTPRGPGAAAGSDRGETNAARIVRFLLTHSGGSYRPAEIAAETGIKTNSVRAVLTRLRARGIVRHDTPHWTIGDAEKAVEEFLLP